MDCPGGYRRVSGDPPTWRHLRHWRLAAALQALLVVQAGGPSEWAEGVGAGGGPAATPGGPPPLPMTCRWGHMGLLMTLQGIFK